MRKYTVGLTFLLVAVLIATAGLALTSSSSGAVGETSITTGYKISGVSDLIWATEHLGYDSPADLQKAGVQVIHFILAGLSGVTADDDECALGLGSVIDPTGPYSYTTVWTAGESVALDWVTDHYCITDSQAQSYGGTILTFFAGMDSAKNGTSAVRRDPPATTTTTRAPTTTTTSALVAPSVPRNVYAEWTTLDDGSWGILVTWSAPASSGSSPIDNYVVDVLPYTSDGNSLDPVSIGRGDTGTAMLISGIDGTLNHAVRVAAFNGGGGSDTKISPFSDLAWVEEPSTPTTTTAPPAATIGGSWDCSDSILGWSCSGNIDKLDYSYEYWNCNESILGWSCSGNIDKLDYSHEYWDCSDSILGWSCSGNIDKLDYSHEYWNCNESILGWSCSGDIDKETSSSGNEYWDCSDSILGWSCSGDGRKAIFTIPVPIAVS